MLTLGAILAGFIVLRDRSQEPSVHMPGSGLLQDSQLLLGHRLRFSTGCTPLLARFAIANVALLVSSE
jgi:hypothetical protein